ncbi:hypothetical protein V8E54_014032 [Elaphomyces granulatus]
MINHLNQLHNERIIGSVLDVEPIVVADGPHEYTRDWAFIELYRNRFDWSTFTVYVGGNLTPSYFGKLMFPQPEDQADYECPDDGGDHLKPVSRPASTLQLTHDNPALLADIVVLHDTKSLEEPPMWAIHSRGHTER